MNTGNEYDSYRLLIERADGAEILLIAEGHGFSLPAIRVLRWERVSLHIIDALREVWDVEAYCLFAPDSRAGAGNPRKYYLVEVCRPDALPPDGWQWSPIESLSEDVFKNLDDFRIIHSAKAALTAYADGSTPGFFGKPQWLQEVFEWVEDEIIPLGLSLTGKFRQLNASPTFSLMRIETDGPALWFKAVGKPNLHEYSITRHLARLFPRFVPRLIGWRTDWNAWLSVETEGAHLSDTTPLSGWQQVATTLADLQIASSGHGLHFINAGCRDIRTRSLHLLVDPFFECMAELMELQTKSAPPPLTGVEIHSLAAEIRSCLDELSASNIPNTLGHLDFNPGNIFLSPEHCVFLDWAEGSVGHPFFTFQYLLEHRGRFHGRNFDSEKALVSSYTSMWHAFASPDDIAESLVLVPLLAAFGYAAGLSWKDPDVRQRPVVASYLRSLVRRMKREADALQKLRVECLS